MKHSADQTLLLHLCSSFVQYSAAESRDACCIVVIVPAVCWSSVCLQITQWLWRGPYFPVHPATKHKKQTVSAVSNASQSLLSGTNMIM